MAAHSFALLECDVPVGTEDPRIAQLERKALESSQEFLQKCHQDGAYRTDECPRWVSATDFSKTLQRPARIGKDDCLRLYDGCHLLFGCDSIGFWHALRFARFVRDPDWQEAMLGMLHGYIQMFDSTRAIITRDESPIALEFYRGATFEESLARGINDEREVSGIDDLYKIVDEHGTWDSHGYLRLL